MWVCASDLSGREHFPYLSIQIELSLRPEIEKKIKNRETWDESEAVCPDLTVRVEVTY